MINSIFADPYHCIDVMNQLNKNKVDTLEMPQTPNRLVQPTNLLYELVLRGKLKHDANPVLRWMISNCILREYSSGGLKIDKEKGNESGKIDGIDALINSLVPFIQSDDGSYWVAETWN